MNQDGGKINKEKEGRKCKLPSTIDLEKRRHTQLIPMSTPKKVFFFFTIPKLPKIIHRHRSGYRLLRCGHFQPDWVLILMSMDAIRVH